MLNSLPMEMSGEGQIQGAAKSNEVDISEEWRQSVRSSCLNLNGESLINCSVKYLQSCLYYVALTLQVIYPRKEIVIYLNQ